MAYDLEEQEQLAEMKAWWNKYGNFILTVITIVLLGFAAYNGWQWYQREQASQAAGVYGQLEKALAARDADKVGAFAEMLTSKYGGTAYATMAALQAAKVQAETGKADRARESLQWVIDKSSHGELKAIAQVRLAGVLLDEKKYDEALRALAGDVPAAQVAAVADRRGDVLVAQNKLEEARAAYSEALAKADEQHPLRQLIQLKLDALPASGS
ncbi:MAG TPA: tetratricopeptide repeat protein [Burkholderiaceae bacterium]|nr:tetratricopeptide repeat protein [Burkholderiaceae bacterium]